MTLCGWGGYDQLCCQASPKLLLGLDLGLGCDNCLETLKSRLIQVHKIEQYYYTEVGIV